MPVWTKMDGGNHWADLPALEAWARNALDLASEANETRLTADDPAARDEQGVVLSRAIDALGAAYACANLSPTTDPTWLATTRSAYGADFDVASGTVTVSNPTAWLAKQATDVYAAVTGTPASSYKVFARAWLHPNAQAATTCILPDDAPDVCSQFAVSLAWTGRAKPGGAACSDPNGDWSCVAWAAPPGGAVSVLPAAVWSMGIIRLVAQTILAGPRAWLVAALGNGGTAISPDGDAPPPDDTSLDIASAVRPLPAPPAPVPTPTPAPAPAPTPVPYTAPPQQGSIGDLLVPMAIGAGLIGLVMWGQAASTVRRSKR